jgi:hypothetical protein
MEITMEILFEVVPCRILSQVQSKRNPVDARPSKPLMFANDLTEWLMTGSVTQLVLAIISKDSRTPLERWVFDITLVEPAPDSGET